MWHRLLCKFGRHYWYVATFYNYGYAECEHCGKRVRF